MQRVTRLAFAAVLMLSSTEIVQAQPSSTSSGTSGTSSAGRSERRYTDRFSGGSNSGESQRLFVVIEASAGKRPNDIHQIVKLGLEYLKKERKFDYEDIRVQPVSSSLYNGMKSLFRGEVLDPLAEGDSTTAVSGASIKLMPGGKSTWEVGTGGAFVRAKSITVYFERDEDGKVITVAESQKFETAPVTAMDQAFRFHSPGVYLFTLESEIAPSRCEIELLVDGDGTATPQIYKSDWPQENLYYLLLIDKFVGDRRVLFGTLRDNHVVGNGLKDVQTVESATISLATFIDSIDTGTSGWDDERHYHVRVKKPDDKFPKRAWMYFPLNAETAKSELARLKNICSLGAEDRQLLLETIRTSAVIDPTSKLLSTSSTTGIGSTSPATSTSGGTLSRERGSTAGTPAATGGTAANAPSTAASSAASPSTVSAAGGPVVPTNICTANAPPMWYEIPAETKAGSSFARILEVAIDPAVPLTTEATFGLVIYEFNEEVILSIGNSYIQQTEHPRWSDGVKKLSTIAPDSSAASKGTGTSTTPAASNSR